MRSFYLIVLILLVISCSKETIKIMTYDDKKVDRDNALIKTTKFEINNQEDIIKEPEINIISPKDG